MTLPTDRSPLPPKQDRRDAGGGWRFSPVPKAGAATYASLDFVTLKISPFVISTWVIFADAEFSITVETPKEGVFAAPPGITNPFTANSLAVIKGKWPSLRVTTTGAVHVLAYPTEMQLF